MARRQVSPLERGAVVPRQQLWTAEGAAVVPRQRLGTPERGAVVPRQQLWTAEGGVVVPRQRLWTRQRAWNDRRRHGGDRSKGEDHGNQGHPGYRPEGDRCGRVGGVLRGDPAAPALAPRAPDGLRRERGLRDRAAGVHPRHRARPRHVALALERRRRPGEPASGRMPGAAARPRCLSEAALRARVRGHRLVGRGR